MAHTYDLREFKAKFEILRERGFIRSRRNGPTGVGHTLEQELGMAENNIAVPDLGEVELKAHRIDSRSMMTLFAISPKVWQVKRPDAVRHYGTPHKDKKKNGRLGLYYTMSQTPNGKGLFLHIETDTISVRHISGQVIAVWELQELAQRFMQKIPAVVVVSALYEMRDGREWFSYTRAQLAYETSGDIFREQIAAGNVLLDLRVREAKDHGTAFRVRKDNLSHLFGKVEEV